MSMLEPTVNEMVVRKHHAITKNWSVSKVGISNLTLLWKPYVMFLRLLGIFNFGFLESPSFSITRILRSPWSWYCLLIVLESWISVIGRIISSREHKIALDKHCVEFWLGVSWMISQSICITAFFVYSFCESGFRQVFVLWSQIRLLPSNREVVEKRIRATAWGTLCAFLVLTCMQMTAQFKIFKTYHITEEDVLYWSHRSVLGCVRLLNTVINVNIIGFINLVCFTWKILFTEVNQMLMLSVTHKNWRFQESFNEQLRDTCKFFHLVVKLVNASNEIFGLVIGMYLSTYVFQMIFNTFQVIFTNEHDPNFFGSFSVHRYYLCESFLALLSITVTSSLVNHEAHKAYEILCEIDLEELHPRQQFSVMTLQNRLTGTSIGMTIFGIQVVGKQMFPSVISLYITYVFLGLQLGVEYDNSK